MSDINITDLLERITGCINNAEYVDEVDTLVDAFVVIEAQAAEIEKLREAVEYYADRDNQCPNEGPWGVNSTDFGLVALKALKALGETK